MPERRLQLLLIEDNPADARLVREILAEAREPFYLKQADSLAVARDLLLTDAFDAILLDLTLPDSSDMATYRDVRALAPGSAVVILTGRDDDDLARRAIAEGAQDYIVKGMDSRSLLRIVRYAIERFRDQRDLKRNEETLRHIVDNMPVLITARDESGNIVFWNQECERVTGYAAEDVVGNSRALELLYPDPEYRNRMLAQWPRRSDEYRDWEWELVTKKGERRIIAWTNQSARFPIPGWSSWSTGIDVTARHQAEASLRRSEAGLAEAQRIAGIGNWHWDISTGRLWWSDQLYRLFGYSPGEVRPGYRRLMRLIHPDDRHRVDEMVAEATFGGGNFVFEYRIVRADGAVRYLHEQAEVTRDAEGRPVRVSGTLQDVTERKLAEMELTRAKEEAEKASASKSRFLAAASHDLRQPLQALSMFVTVLANRDHTPGTQEIVGRIEASLESLRELLNELLDMSKLEAGMVIANKAVFPVENLLARLASEFAILAERKGLLLTAVPTKAHIRSDPMLLERILRNLLANAVRYTEKGRILFGCRRRGNRLMIQVWDTGIGIAKDKQQAIFEEFYQIDNAARQRARGLGLGLSIVDRLAKLMDHKVKVRSRVGKGSLFEIAVELARPARQAAAVARSAGESNHHAVILLVDDDPDVLAGIEMLLQVNGYRVLAARNIRDALKLAEQAGKNIDLVIADYRLGDHETGADAIRKVRGVIDRPLPGLIITGDTAPARLREAKKSGFALLHKPVASNELLAAVSTTLVTMGKQPCAPRPRALGSLS